MKHSKRYTEVKSQVTKGAEYELDEAIAKVKSSATAKFDESVEIHINLGVDPRKADQMIRNTVTLPHGIGKTVRVMVFCKEERVKEALDAGADYAGMDEYVEKIQGGWFDFESAVATPDVMPQVGRIGKVLGPRGLMPNPKTNTVTNDIASAIAEIKAGRLSFRVDRYGILHLPVGKASFAADKLRDNISAFISTVQKLKPASAKGQYIKRITLSSTMGPGIRVNKQNVLLSVK